MWRDVAGTVFVASATLMMLVASGSARADVLLSGVYFDGVLPGEPEPDSAVRLVNTDEKNAADVGGYVVSEEFTPQKAAEKPAADEGAVETGHAHKKKGGKAGKPPRTARLPDGAHIPPGGEIWIAATATGFAQVFGHKPDYEASDTDVAVPDVVAPDGFLLMPAQHGTVALLDAKGEPVDFVPYEVTKEPYFAAGSFSGVVWKGEPLRLKKTSATSWKGQVLARDRDEKGHVVANTHSAADWDSGFSRKVLGDDATHRVELAGQSRFIARPHKDVHAKILATSAPDNNFAELIKALDGAKHELRVRIYELTNPKIVDALIKAQQRGVKVWIYLEGSPVGGIADQERWLVDRAHKAGIEIWFLATPKGSKIHPRYRFDHSKYVLIDDKLAIIGSENYGRTGVPAANSYGNRGWMLHVDSPEIVRELREVWDADFRPGVMADVLSIDASPTDPYGLPYRDPAFVPDEEVHKGLYDKPEKPLLSEGKMNLELVLSPDTSLNEHSAIMGMMERAKKTLYLEQNSIRRRWGKKEDSSDPDSEQRDDDDTTPNLPLQAVVAAARRGVAVRVLLDSTWYNVQGDDERDNDDTVRWLDDLARKEHLDIAAKVINLETTHLEKIHTKGIIVDGAEVFVGSINWTENSFKGNREVGLVVGDAKISGYYERLFKRDWAASRIFGAATTAVTDVRAAPSATAKVIGHLARGDRVSIVGEHGTIKDSDRAAWAEVSLGGANVGFVDESALGTPQATAPEALHVVGRDAVVDGRVVATDVNEHRVQLRFTDEKRPPFTAVIFAKNEAAFTAKGVDPKAAYQGHEVRIKGPVTTYRGPEVVLSSPDQIEIVR